MAGIQHVE